LDYALPQVVAQARVDFQPCDMENLMKMVRTASSAYLLATLCGWRVLPLDGLLGSLCALFVVCMLDTHP